MIPYGKQDILQEDIDSVVETLTSDFITQGPAVKRFEEDVSSYVGCLYGIAVSNATAALHLACIALGVGPGDLVWTSPISFVASANCARYCGAEVDFVDIEPDTFNMCPISLSKKLEDAKRNNRLPKVVIPVHMAGQSCKMHEINNLSKQYGFKIIEDASHAVGAEYRGNKVGSCKYSDITVFSFHPVKIITTGEGGVVLTNSERIAKEITKLRSHSITRDACELEDNMQGDWYYEQQGLGFNYRLTDIQAALGSSQFKRLDDYVAKRNQLADTYRGSLSSLPIKLPTIIDDSYSSYHLYIIRLKSEYINSTKKEVFAALRGMGIGVNLHYIPIYFQPYYRNLGFSKGICPNAEEYYDQAISIPIFPTMTKDQQLAVVDSIRKAVK